MIRALSEMSLQQNLAGDDLQNGPKRHQSFFNAVWLFATELWIAIFSKLEI
jgi:hypothetical protein